jgi:hypothetical protein
MDLRRVSLVGLVVIAWSVLGGLARAQLITGGESVIGQLNPFHPFDPSEPKTVGELCHRLDCIAEELRNDGLVVVKQPDVFSQARMTRFRNDFDAQMSSDLGNFHLVLAARINRLDAATTTQTTALSASLSAPGTTNLSTPDATKFISQVSGSNSPFQGGTSLFPTTIDPTKSAFGTLSAAPNTLAGAGANAAMGIGVDPTVYLDEKKRFLDHLNEIRRISLGPDQNDSSGYGLYLVRLPISITPGECTYRGYGAELSVAVEHEFTDLFLPTTFQNLVVNDLVDQLGPFLYEIIRSRFYDKLAQIHDARQRRQALEVRTEVLVDSLMDNFAQKIVNSINAGQPQPLTLANHTGPAGSDPADPLAIPLQKFILQPLGGLTGNPDSDKALVDLLCHRLAALADARLSLDPGNSALAGRIGRFRAEVEAIRRGGIPSPTLETEVLEFSRDILTDARKGNVPNMNLLRPFFKALYKTARPGDVDQLDKLLQPSADDKILTAQLAQNNVDLSTTPDRRLYDVNLASSRTAKQLYPIAPRDLLSFFGEDNVYRVAKEIIEASRSADPSAIRLVDVRNYLRHTLQPAYYAMTTRTARQGSPPPLDDDEFLQSLHEAIQQREFRPAGQLAPSQLEELNKMLVDRLAEGRENIRHRPIAALCWAIAVDAVLLDLAFNHDARRVLSEHGVACDLLDTVHFYYSKFRPNEAAKAIFKDYVRYRWPIITFSLDPVTDQQNIADSFNLKRDLQLALSYAFATGQIGFNQLNTFRRQIEQSSDTIALNRTITAFAHGGDDRGYDTFSFRFTPRFQNPPNQRTNIGVIASQLIGGGPGPDYQIKKSKLEAGMRELTAVLLIPTFLPSMRMNVAGNWFKLTDPEHLIYHTKRLMEQGRKVQETRQAVLDYCSVQQYRGADLRVLQGKLAQLDTMLPMQSKVVQLPFENTASGFDLFSEGATALVPELTGYSGVDVIQPPPASASTPGVLSTSSGGTGLQIQTNFAIPAVATTTSIVGGTNSIADLFVFGKYISLLDTRVVAGGRSAAFEILSREVVHVQVPANAIPTTTDDGNSYVEIFLSTPNGISNSLLVPYKAAASTSTQVAFTLSTSSFDVYYQWLAGPGGKPALIATVDPGRKGVTIGWDSPTSLAPRRLQVTFQGSVGGQGFTFAVPADLGGSGDYSINGQVFTVTLLNALQQIVPSPTTLTTPVTLNMFVQPWIPPDAEDLRVRTEPKPLASSLTVNLNYNATGRNAIPGVAPAAPAGGGAMLGPAKRELPVVDLKSKDTAVKQTAQSAPSAPAALSLPQPPPFLNRPVLQSPNVGSEAEQVARMLTGQPFNPNQVKSTLTSQLAGTPAGAAANQVATTVANAATTQTAQPIVVMPAPVVVMPPKPDIKKPHAKSRFHQMLKSVGNRVSQGMSALQPTPGP